MTNQKNETPLKCAKFDKGLALTFDFKYKNPSDLIHTQFRAEVLEISLGKTKFFIYFSNVNFFELYDLDINLGLKYNSKQKTVAFS